MATAANRHLDPARAGVRARRTVAVTVAALLAGPALATLPVTAAAAAAPGLSSRTSVHLDNPYVGARPYVDPNWAARLGQ
jgi:cellulose 1,4-beta-cellobiosidase